MQRNFQNNTFSNIYNENLAKTPHFVYVLQRIRARNLTFWHRPTANNRNLRLSRISPCNVRQDRTLQPTDPILSYNSTAQKSILFQLVSFVSRCILRSH
jgi:hypothetical protein